jgi:hypothetical protein
MFVGGWSCFSSTMAYFPSMSDCFLRAPVANRYHPAAMSP